MDGVGAHWADCGQGLDLAGDYIKTSAMARTLDFLALELTLAQRPAVMRADVIDGIDVATIVAQRDPQAVDRHGFHFALGNLVDAGDIDRLWGHVTKLPPDRGAAQTCR